MKDHFILREWQLSDAASLAENANNIHIWNNVRDYFPLKMEQGCRKRRPCFFSAVPIKSIPV
jgi:hypothetical protein